MLAGQQKLHVKLSFSYCTLVPDNPFKLTYMSARQTNIWAPPRDLLGGEGLHLPTFPATFPELWANASAVLSAPACLQDGFTRLRRRRKVL